MEILGDPRRAQNARTVFFDRAFSYRLDPDWAKWPDGYAGCTAACGCCDKEGNLYVSTRGTKDPIVVFAPDGTCLRTLGAGLFSDNLHGLFFTPRRTLLCTDGDRHVVRELSETGELIRDFGTLDQPSDTGYEPNVCKWLVRERRLPADMPFEATFSFLDRFKTIKRAGPPFNKPTRMIESESGEFFASDGYGNAAIHKFSSDGKLLKTWGAPGTGTGELRLPHGVWLDRLDRLWVSDRENCRVHVYTTGGERIATIGSLIYRPAEVWSDDDNIYIGEVDGGITILDMELHIVSQLGYFNSPLMAHGLCGDGKGNLYLQTLWFHKGNNVARLVRV